jgi:hypothetical protein
MQLCWRGAQALIGQGGQSRGIDDCDLTV